MKNCATKNCAIERREVNEASGVRVTDALLLSPHEGGGAGSPALPGTRPLRIAVIGLRGIPSRYGGVETACDRLYSILASRGHHVTAYCRPEYVRTSSTGSYRGITLIGAPSIRWKALDTLSYAATSLLTAMLQERYDVIHLHTLAPGLYAGLCRLLRTPTVVTVHGLDWQRAKWKGAGATVLRAAERVIVGHATSIIVVSEALQTYFRTEYGRSTQYIPNGVDWAPDRHHDGAETLARFGLTVGQYITYIGRLVPEKRVDDLIRAFRSTDTSHRLAIVGEAGYTDRYRQQLHELARNDARVVFTGQQDAGAVEAIFRGAAAFVLPSSIEGLSVALLECMSYGTPAIASDIPPNRQLLGPVAEYDLFFAAGDVEALTDRLRRVLSQPAKYTRIALAARARARSEYGWDAVADATEAVYRDVTRAAERFEVASAAR